MSTAEGSEVGKGNRPTPLMVGPEEGALYWIAGGFDEIRLTAGQTRGALGVTEVIETNERGGGGPPLHVHTREDETYHGGSQIG
jgi:hypothetical protein